MPKAALKESDIIQAIKKAMPQGSVVRFNPGPMSPRGISDILVTWDNREYFIEIKVNNTKLTVLQAEFLKKRVYPILLHIGTNPKPFTLPPHYFMRCEARFTTSDEYDTLWGMMAMLATLLELAYGRPFFFELKNSLRF